MADGHAHFCEVREIVTDSEKHQLVHFNAESKMRRLIPLSSLCLKCEATGRSLETGGKLIWVCPEVRASHNPPYLVGVTFWYLVFKTYLISVNHLCLYVAHVSEEPFIFSASHLACVLLRAEGSTVLFNLDS